MTYHPRFCVVLCVAAFIVLPVLSPQAQAVEPVKVFILAGQSNMVGHGKVEMGREPGTYVPGESAIEVEGGLGSLRWMVNNAPDQYGYDGTQPLVDASGNWLVRSDVKAYVNVDNVIKKGNLTTGFGAGAWIGPEYGFGQVLGNALDQDVLLIKMSWGGKSLAVDFLPPSAESYPEPQAPGDKGYYYKQMVDGVNATLTNLGTEFPELDGRSYEIAGFGWHQGWNDRVNATYSAAYEENLVDLINDVRSDFGKPNLPFVIGTTGMDPPTNLTTVELAQLAVADPAQHPEFEGTVATVDTRPYWREAAESPSDFGYHWNHNGISHFEIGEGMGDAMLTLLGTTPPVNAFLRVDQQTGEITLVNAADSSGDMALKAYSITSAAAALDPANWTPIDGHYDSDGDSSVSGGDWTVTQSASGELGEQAVAGGPDGLIAVGVEVSLGIGAWIQNPTKDLQATYTDPEGNVIHLSIQYTGNDNEVGDLNFDGTVDGADWAIFVAGDQMEMSGMSGPLAYQAGDLDGDLDHDIYDFDLFRKAFEEDNPQPMAFQMMLDAYYGVPEPGSMLLLGFGAAGLCLRRRRRTRTAWPAPPAAATGGNARRSAFARHLSAMIVVLVLSLLGGTANAGLLVYEGFDYTAGSDINSPLDGGTGFTGAWAPAQQGGVPTIYDETGDAAKGLTWDGTVNNVPTLPALGSRYIAGGSDSSDRLTAQRVLSQSAGELAGADNVLWASVVWHMEGSNYGRQVGFALGTDGLANRSVNIDTSGNYGAGIGDGIGVGGAFNTGAVTPTVWDNGIVAVRTTDSASTVSYTQDNLVVLKYVFADGASPDRVYAYRFTEYATLSETDFDTNAVYAEYAIDQSTLNVLSFSQSDRSTSAIDEIRLGDTFTDVVSGLPTQTTLTLEVNTLSGEMKLSNPGDESVSINYYQVLSEAHSLDPEGWNSLQDQDDAAGGFPAGDGTGNGWEEGGSTGSHALAEAYLRGDSIFAAGNSISLGAAYDDGVDAQDLAFSYRTDAGQIFDGVIEYITSVAGDINGDGLVDAADYILLKSNFGSAPSAQGEDGDLNNDNVIDALDLNMLAGYMNGAGAAAVTPEPATLALLGGWGLMLMRRRTGLRIAAK